MDIPASKSARRGHHFRRLMARPVTLVLAGLIGVGGIAAAAAGGPIAAAIAVGVGVLILLLVVFVLAAKRAADEFYAGYSSGRGLTWSGTRQGLPGATPLLRKGDSRYSEQTMTGVLPGGLEGTLSLFTYEVEQTDGRGNKSTSYYHFTVLLADVDGCVMQKLYCNRKSGLRALEGAEDAFRKNRRVRLESESFADRYELFIGPEEDENRAKRVFAPSFIVWLTSEETPEKFAFELEGRKLCVNVNRQLGTSADLDLFCQAAGRVVARFQEKATAVA